MKCLWFLVAFFAIQWLLAVGTYLRVSDRPRALEEIGWSSVLDCFSLYSYKALGFVLFGHFKYGDLLLTLICISQVALWIGFVAFMLQRGC